jgi:predicted DNA binding CopG/RHH family protein
MYKIAFLFLTLHNPNIPEIWNLYFKGNEKYFNIYIHTKFPEQVSWKRNNIIKNLKKTEWGFIVSAYMSLFKTALLDKENIKFITISESCLPIKPFKMLYEFIMNEKKQSFIKFTKISKYDYSARLNDNIKKKCSNLIKHYARMCLSRYHVKQLFISENKQKIKLFTKMHVGDEFFLSSILTNNTIKYSKDFAITHDDWDYVINKRNEYNIKIKKLYEKQESDNIDYSNEILQLQKIRDDFSKNPKSITIVSSDDLDNIKNTSSFFYRKFTINSDIIQYYYNNTIIIN